MEQVVRILSRAWFPQRNPPPLGDVHKWPFTHWLQRRRPLAVVTATVWASSLLVAAWIVSGWFWDRAAPVVTRLPTIPMTDPAVASRTIAARHLMGEATAQSGGSTAPSMGQYRLIGAMTASPNAPGFAIFSEHGKGSVPVIEGDEITSGLTLQKVLPDQVIIGHDGRTERLELADQPTTARALSMAPSGQDQIRRLDADKIPSPSQSNERASIANPVVQHP